MARPPLKHLGFVKSGFDSVEDAVLEPAYGKVKDCGFDVVLFFDNMINFKLGAFDKLAPSVVKKVVGQAVCVTRKATELELKVVDKAWTTTWKVAKLEMGFISELRDKGVIDAVKDYTIVPILDAAKGFQAGKDAAKEGTGDKTAEPPKDATKDTTNTKPADPAKDVPAPSADNKPTEPPKPPAQDVPAPSPDTKPKEPPSSSAENGNSGSAAADTGSSTAGTGSGKDNGGRDILDPFGFVKGAVETGSAVASGAAKTGSDILNPFGIGK